MYVNPEQFEKKYYWSVCREGTSEKESFRLILRELTEEELNKFDYSEKKLITNEDVSTIYEYNINTKEFVPSAPVVHTKKDNGCKGEITKLQFLRLLDVETERGSGLKVCGTNYYSAGLTQNGKKIYNIKFYDDSIEVKSLDDICDIYLDVVSLSDLYLGVSLDGNIFDEFSSSYDKKFYYYLGNKYSDKKSFKIRLRNLTEEEVDKFESVLNKLFEEENVIVEFSYDVKSEEFYPIN